MLKPWCGIVRHILNENGWSRNAEGARSMQWHQLLATARVCPPPLSSNRADCFFLCSFFFFHITPKNRALASSYPSLDGGGSRLRAERRPPQQRDGATFGRDIARKPLFLLVLLRSAFLFACLRGTRRTSRECCAASRRLGFPISRGGPWLPPSFVDCFFLYLHVCARHFLLRD